MLLILEKSVSFENGAACLCGTLLKHFTLQTSIMQFNTFMYHLSASENINAFYKKTRPSQGLLPDVKLLKKMFSTILDGKKSNRAPNVILKIMTVLNHLIVDQITQFGGYHPCINRLVIGSVVVGDSLTVRELSRFIKLTWP